MKRFVSIAAATVVAASGLLVASPAAASTCDTYWNYNRDGERIAQLCDSATAMGRGSFTLQARGDYRGVDKHMSLRVCRYNSSGPYDCVRDAGQFLYYAGPIADPGGCLQMDVVMYDGNGNRILDRTTFRCN